MAKSNKKVSLGITAAPAIRQRWRAFLRSRGLRGGEANTTDRGGSERAFLVMLNWIEQNPHLVPFGDREGNDIQQISQNYTGAKEDDLSSSEEKEGNLEIELIEKLKLILRYGSRGAALSVKLLLDGHYKHDLEISNVIEDNDKARPERKTD